MVVDLFLTYWKISNTLKLDGLLAMIDIQKAFDPVDYSFLISTLERYGFGNRFVKWVKILLKNQESCIISGANVTKYFKLKIGKRQADPISAYQFILVLEIVFLFIKENKNIAALKGVKWALCGMKCIDLTLSTIKILGVHFSYNKKIENDENLLKQITSIEKVLKL